MRHAVEAEHDLEAQSVLDRNHEAVHLLRLARAHMEVFETGKAMQRAAVLVQRAVQHLLAMIDVWIEI